MPAVSSEGEDQSCLDNQIISEAVRKEKFYKFTCALYSHKLNAIKNYYLKKRYILRIQENLNKFASL